MSTRSSSVAPITILLHSTRPPRQLVQQPAQVQDSLALQGRVVADVEAVKVDVIGARIPPPRLRADNTTWVGLAHLVAAARRAAPELDAVFAQAGHDALTQPRVGMPEHQRERVVAAALDCEVGLIG